MDTDSSFKVRVISLKVVSQKSLKTLTNLRLNIFLWLQVFSGAGNRLDGKKKGTEPAPVEGHSVAPKRSVN